MSQPVRQVIVLAVVIIALTLGAMLLLLSAFGNPVPSPPRTTTPAAASPTPSLEAPSPATPAENSVIALILGGLSLLLVAMLSLSLLRARRAPQEP